jgi:hypothetical protein
MKVITMTYVNPENHNLKILYRLQDRCYNPNSKIHKYYKDVEVCQQWQDDHQTFIDYLTYNMPESLADFQARNPGKRATIDRIDNKGHYEPGNVRWATDQEQNHNTSQTRLNENLVKRALWLKYFRNLGTTEIFEHLKSHGYTGSRYPVYKVLNRDFGYAKSKNAGWSNINIDKEIAEYEEFGIVPNF